MRVTLVGAHHPRGRFSEMRRLDVALVVPLSAFVAPKANVTAVVDAVDVAARASARGVVTRSGLVVSLRLAFPAAGDFWELAVTSGRQLSVRALTELRGTLGPVSRPELARSAVLRLDVLRGAVQPGGDWIL